MKFCWSTLQVKNMEKSIAFYTEIIGLEVVRKFSAGPDTEIAFLGNSETKIELICDGNMDKINVGDDISWGFEVDSLDEALDMVKEKEITIVNGPVQPNPHVKYFFIKDQDGMNIQIVENIH